MPWIARRTAFAALAALLVACGDADPPRDLVDAADTGVAADTGADGGALDAGDTGGRDVDNRDDVDASADASPSDVGESDGSDAAVDADEDASVGDVATDPAVDAATDVGRDTADVSADADAAVDADATADSGGVPVPGFGAIEGACGVLTSEVLADASPVAFRNAIDFGADPFDEDDVERLTDGGFEVYTDPNAGGSSILSETFAFEVLARCEGATLVATELEVDYDPAESAKTDFVVAIDDRIVGVSVTRAVTFPRDAELGVDEAARRMTGKLEGILESSENVVGDVVWERQILHVIAWGPEHADDVAAAWDTLASGVRADTILVVTTSNGDDTFLYD